MASLLIRKRFKFHSISLKLAFFSMFWKRWSFSLVFIYSSDFKILLPDICRLGILGLCLTLMILLLLFQRSNNTHDN